MYSKLKSVTDVIKIGHVVIIWLILNLISASFTLLYTDETYYRLFAQQLSFGYFDHPPMIALFIRLGTIISNNETGVRLLSVLSVAIALYFTYRLSGVQKPVLFMAAILSVFALNLLGFMALPDAPLLLFTVLFFVAYKRFLIKESTRNAIILSFVMAALLYSKYHGILVILFTITSNLKLLKSPKFWLASIIGVFLFVPHLLWQVNNSFVTFSFQLLDRSASHYHFSVTLEYIIGQLLFYGPVTTPFMYIALIKNKGNNQFERALIWNMLGITIFFLVGTLKGRVEVNWTLPVLAPLLIIFMKYSDSRPVFRKRFYYCAAPVIVLILLFRIQMIYPALNLSISRIDNLRNQKDFVGEVVSKSNGLPIVACTYQKAGIISYYSNTFVPSINLNGRRNQFSLWHSEDSLRFRKVAYINNYLKEGVNIQNPFFRDYKVSIIDSLPVMSDIIISAEPVISKVRINEEFSIRVSLDAAKTYTNYKDAGGYNTRLHAELWTGDSLLKEQVCLSPLDDLLSIYKGIYIFRFVAPADRGRYKIKIGLKTSTLGTWSTRKVIVVNVY